MSIAAIRGMTDFKWISSAFLLPISALMTFLCGVPLGTEGPSVQMGTAVGDATVQLLGGKKHIGWRRYIMTGGASAGFSLATGAPITAILFSLEEIHSRFSPLLFSVASISVIVSQLTAHLLSHFGFGNLGLFHITDIPSMPLDLFGIPITVGLLAGILSVVFTHLYHKIDHFMQLTLKNVSEKLKFPIIFALIAIIGFFLSDALGTGHSLIDSLFDTKTAWYMLIIIFLVRAVFMMITNTAGITGGIFIPTLAFGALIGGICSNLFISLNIISSDYYSLLICLGMAAFLGATSRIPVTAAVFAIEALSGINNVIPILISVISAFFIMELSGLNDFSDTVVKAKARAAHKGKTPYFIEVPLTVYKNSFVIDKELNDILWPASCVVLSIERKNKENTKTRIAEGDVLKVHYKTYDPVKAAEEFEILVGDQSEDIDKLMRPI